MAGVTASETKAAGVTFNAAKPTIVPIVAVMPVLPMATLVASPLESTLATLALELLQDTLLVRANVLPSL